MYKIDNSVLKTLKNINSKLHNTLSKINELSISEKYKYYSIYLSKQITLKNDFLIVDLKNENKVIPYNDITYSTLTKTNRQYKGVGYAYLWDDLKIKTFEEFISNDNIVIIDTSENWKELGYASRYIIRHTGIYDESNAYKDFFMTT